MTVFSDEIAFSSAISTTGFLDFETFAPGPGSPIAVAGNDSVFTGQGFTFTSLGGFQLYVEEPGFIPSADGNFLSPGGRPFVGGDNNNDSLRIDLSGTVNAFGFEFIDGVLNPFGGTVESIDVFGASGLLFSETTSGIDYFGIIADEAITHVIVTEGTSDGDDVGYDNFRTGNAFLSIHAPGAGAILLGGVLALGLRRDRMRRR
ncbi:MAG: hypothetical protein ACPGRZ_05405 [Alphaproteobacteria bacterium]